MKKTLLLLLLFPYIQLLIAQNSSFPPINPDNITIVRDTFGIPHIFAKTDAEVAYGFAWANAEDNFKTMQETYSMGKALNGRIKGKEGAAIDFLNESLGLKELVDEQINTISPEFMKYLDGYCQGINAFARKFPKEVIEKRIFPVTVKDAFRTYAFIACYLAFVHKPIQDIIGGKFDTKEVPMGSNAFALNNTKTVDGNTYLVINPHQPIEGPFSFHEAQLCSEEGLDIIGSHFPAGTSIFMGNNENLGWGMTFNDYDLVDTYKLKMHPTNKLQYEFDGEWKTLETRKIKLKVKLFGPIKITVKKTTYISVYGPTYESKGNYYSVRSAAATTIKFPEQFYFMNKAQTFSEFYKILQMQGFSRFNIIYADKESNIFCIDNGRVPIRAKGYDWTGILPGNTSKTLWKNIYKEEQLPQQKNPDCGYVFNTNNTPFKSTCDKDNLDSTNYERFPKDMGLKYTMNNRSNRFIELFSEKEKFSYDDMKRIKFDTKLSMNAPFVKSVKEMFLLNPKDYPDLSSQIKYLNDWDKNATDNSIGAAYTALIFNYLFKKHHLGYADLYVGVKLSTADYIDGIGYAKNHFLKYFGKTSVTLGELQRHIRGKKNVEMPGFPDVLAANYTVPTKNGRYTGFVGDSYSQVVSFSKTGPVKIQTLLPFGESNRPESKHYTDQMDLWSKQILKTVEFSNKIDGIYAERIYHPK